ncbi:MAG: hypothetical protein A2Y69_09335 [Candidatus Aminicenantes bacterium RBG_13_59_9]|nr:MAG: hypothetical protein A2Y69_09335 [Candidatus Aminicenantes bacterium RBG_13_59_9]
MSIPLITSIKLNLSKKLKDKAFRHIFFRGQTQDTIAMSIVYLRKMRGKRQSDLAIETGMKQSAISRIEQAEYSGWSLSTLWRVAEALDARLNVTFEPIEEVIRYYQEKESENYQLEQKALVSKAGALMEDISMDRIAEKAANEESPFYTASEG